MLSRYMGMSVKSQSYLFTFGFGLTLLGMSLTEMWLPMVAGAIIMAGLTVESWIRVSHIIPLYNEIHAMQKQIKSLQVELRSVENQD